MGEHEVRLAEANLNIRAVANVAEISVSRTICEGERQVVICIAACDQPAVIYFPACVT